MEIAKKQYVYTALFLLVLSLSSNHLAVGQILFQAFNWESWRQQGGWYNFLKGKVDEIANASVTHVWLPPPSHSISEQAYIDYYNFRHNIDATLISKTRDYALETTAFDFTTKGVLQEAVNGELWRLRDANGSAIGMIGWQPDKAVTFIDNHDTGSTQKLWPFPADKVMQGYAYILTHPGIPCIFYDHYYDWGLKGELNNLVAVRIRNGIQPGSAMRVLATDADVYLAVIREKVMVKVGTKNEVASGMIPSNFRLAASGSNYAVWEIRS